jgi:TRAP transporter TAXI family solute receptor
LYRYRLTSFQQLYSEGALMRHATNLVLIASLVVAAGPIPEQELSTDPVRIAQGQNATVGLIAGDAGSTDTRIAADIAAVVDDSDRLRILPILGQGSVRNIADLIYLKGVDVAIVHADSLAQTMQRDEIPREGEVQYIAKLFQEEVHVLARHDIASLDDLNGQPVEAGAPGSGTELTATTLLYALHVSANLEHDGLPRALERLSNGEVAAVFIIGGKPVPIVQAMARGTGVHFLPIPLNAQLVDTYLPTNLDHQHYPNLVPPGPPIDTVAVGAVLVTLAAPPDSARAKRVNRFIDTLFNRFDRFREPGFHPKWQEVNLSAQVPGWMRYPEATTLLKKQEQADEANLRGAFDAYLDQSGQQASGMTDGRREAVFRDFMHWQERHGAP